jgi:hypothetical protein
MTFTAKDIKSKLSMNYREIVETGFIAAEISRLIAISMKVIVFF